MLQLTEIAANVGAFIRNWRGVMSQKSFRVWKDCGVPRTGLMKIVISALNQISQSQDMEGSQMSSKKEDHISGCDFSVTLMIDVVRCD